MDDRLESHLETLGQHLHRWRVITGNTQTRTAAAAGVAPGTLSRLETGKGGSVETLLEVCEVLGIADTLLDALDPTDTDIGRARTHLWDRARATRIS